jgi:pyrrolidone-carboxylate peptidase
LKFKTMEKVTSSEETENLQSKSVNQVSQNEQEQSINSSDPFVDNSRENMDAIKLQKSADNSEETVELQKLQENATAYDNSQMNQQQDIISSEKQLFPTSSLQDYVNDNPEHTPEKISDAAIQATSEYQKWKAEFNNSELENYYTEEDILSACRLAITEMRKEKVCRDVSEQGEIYLQKTTSKARVIDSKEKHSLTNEEKEYGCVSKTTDKAIDIQCDLFKKEIKKAASKEEISEIINAHGLAIWNHAKTQVQASSKKNQDAENWNDQAVYKARLKMRISLKNSSNPLLKTIKKGALDKYIETLEEVSRGMTTAEFDEKSEKKILLTGFDPYQGAETNPSGIVALNFDGQKIGNAEIQTAVFPVRYEDFDNGLVEKFFGTKMDGIDAIITVSQTSESKNIDIDRFSANVRGGGPDNNEKSETGKILDDGANFYESSLPYTEILEGEFEEENQRYFYNQTWATDKDDSNELHFPGQIDSQETVWNSEEQVNDLEKLNKSGTPTQGSGGDYLSNEIHYRVSKMRTASNTTKDIPQGHLHIDDTADKEKFMQDMKELITRVVNTLNKNKHPIGN